MGTGFQWQTEAEEWVEQPPEEKGAKRPWFLLLALLTLILPVGLVYSELQQQVAEATARARRSVESSHNLILSSGAATDEDLLRSFISGRDRRWTYDNLELAAEERLFDYPELGLQRQMMIPAAQTPPQITLSPDLTKAEVTAEMAYVVEKGDGVTQTITLERSFVYRRGADRWLWSPPETEYWGDLTSGESEYLRAHFPERDQEVIQRMLADLDGLIGQMCRMDGLDCTPARARPEIEFDTAPFSLLAIERGRWPRSNTLWLPTPSLLGYPADEAAYQALLQGYARRILPPMIADLVGWSCCDQGAFFEAALAWQLDELGLASWPMTMAGYDRLSRTQLPLVALSDHWDAPSLSQLDKAEQEELFALIGYLLESRPSQAAADLQRALTGEISFGLWLRQTGGPTANESAWRLFLFRHSTMAEKAPPYTLPDQQALVQCRMPDAQQLRYLYNPAEDRWQPAPYLPVLGRSSTVYPFDDASFLIQESQGPVRDNEHRITYWRSGMEQPLFEQRSSNPSWLYVSSVDPVRSRAVLTIYNPITRRLENQLFDATSCGQGSCGLTDVPGLLRWSPDGQRSLVTVYGEALPAIHLGDVNGQIQAFLTAGNEPVWLDNETYGYHGLRGDRGAAFFVRRLPDNQIIATVEDTSFWRALPEFTSDILASRFSFGGADAHVGWPGLALISLFDADQNGNRLFRYDWQDGTLHLYTPDADRSTFARFSPDGRQLALYEQAFWRDMADQWRLFLVQQDGSMQPAGPAATDFRVGPLWSRDGQWLLRSDGELVYLMAPGQDYQQPLVSPAGSCSLAVWIER